MQDKHTEEFDLRLRSMLADAEVKPSHRVWKGVSARLDADTAPVAAPWAWMRWAGLGLAVAAALAAGVFFRGTQDSIPTIIHNQEQAMLAQTGEAAGDPAQAEVPAAGTVSDAADQTAGRPASRSAAARPLSGQPAANPETPARTDEAVSGATGVQPAQEQPSAPAAERPAAPARKQRAKQPVTAMPDPFAEPVVKLQEKPRTALYAQGAIGSNEASPRPAPGAWMAPGSESGFSELGASTYGVPFTVGLGVRIYLLPRLSIGTGLDYSLLTRSFTGSFDGESGTVSHTLQYIGVPANVYFDLISANRIKFYVYGGGEAEYCISNKYRLFANPDIVRKYPVDRLQFSLAGGLGVEFRLTDKLGIYLDPGVNYYFNCNQPRNIRTEKPLLVNFDAGLRFNF